MVAAMKYKTLLFLIFILFYNITAFAQFNNTDISYVLEADQVTKVGENMYEAVGNVVLQAKGLTITAEKVMYNSKTTEVQASGSVKIESPEQKLEAEKIVYNLNAETGTAEDIQGFLAPFNYLCAKNMDKTGPTTFTVTDAKISACSGSVPEWSLSMYEGKLDVDGYMQLNHATVNIYDSPFIYVPKFFYPVSSNRKTGFLMPNIGYDETMGAMGNFQYFIAPDVNYDFTIGLGLYSERGVQEQFEARYAHTDESKFYVAAEHIKDFGSEADTQSRWRATLKNQYVPVDNLYINFNGDYVSDYLYTRDYDDYSISMFNKENYQNMFFGEFKLKYVSDYIDTHIYYRRDMLYRDTTTGYTQNQLVRMPSIRANKIVKEIPYVFLEYDLSYDRLVSKNTQYYYTTQNKPKNETEWALNRFGAYGRLYAPIDAKFLTITPSAYIGYIRWQDSTLPFNFNDYYSPDFGGIYTLDESTAEKYWGGADLTLTVKEIYKDYGIFRHSIQNNISLSYSPKLVHPTVNTITNYPNLLFNDVTTYQSSLSYEFITSLIGKGWNIKFTAEQGYDFMAEKNNVLPLEMTLEANVLGYLTNDTELEYKHTGDFEENEPKIQYFSNITTLKFLKYFFVTGSYTFNGAIYKNVTSNTYNTTAQISSGINIWRIVVQGYYKWSGYNTDMSFNGLIPKSYGGSILYNAECWSLGINAEVTRSIVNSIEGRYSKDDAKFFLLFSLRGLGDSNLQIFSLNQEEPN